MAVASADSHSEGQTRQVIASAVSQAFASACSGGDVQALAQAAADAVGNATATAYASASGYVKVSGEHRRRGHWDVDGVIFRGIAAACILFPHHSVVGFWRKSAKYPLSTTLKRAHRCVIQRQG